jgi:hypothetical protein
MKQPRAQDAVRQREGGRGQRVLLLIAGAALALTGCAGTRTAHFGLLAPNEPLVTLVVSEDRETINRECRDPDGIRRILGCQTSRLVDVPGGGPVKAIKIVRYTDALPSEMAFEIDVHELCHAVAAAQNIEDPCHHGNDGVVHAAARAARTWNATAPR